MDRTITVKGTGRVSLPPDQIIIPLVLEASDPEYGAAMEKGGELLDTVRGALAPLGFAKEEIRTTNFNVSTNYESYQDENGRWQQRFAGYICSHHLKLTFDMDTERLSAVAQALAESNAHPQFHIRFTVKEPEAVRSALLEDAARNARAKAETLCRAAGVALGEVQRIDYSWGDLSLDSPTNFVLAESAAMGKRAVAADIAPEDVTVQDNATFVWEIL